MPSATLHLTCAELLSEEPALVPGLRDAMRQHAPFTRLGAVLLDLPFYRNIPAMVVRYWLERPAEHSPAARSLHQDRPDLLAWSLVRAAHDDDRLPFAQRLALLGGALSHMALDMELHPLVNWCARRDARLHGGNESHHHRLTEKYQSLFFHRDLLGVDPIGTWSFFREKTIIVEGAPLFRIDPGPPVYQWLAGALAGPLGDAAPGPRQIARWVRSFRHFGFVVSLPLAGLNSREKGTPENRERYYENATFSFPSLWERAFRRCVDLANLGAETCEAGRFSAAQRDAFLATARICNLSYPEGGDLPWSEAVEVDVEAAAGATP